MVTPMTLTNIVLALGVSLFPSNVEFENLFSSTESVSYDPIDWAEWLDDEKRMVWWQENGWRILEGQKEGVLAGSIQVSKPMSEQWNPMDIGLVPDEITHLAYAMDEDMTLVLFSLQRCETLYSRSLLAKPN